MGNKLVCCRWRWIESPEFTNTNNNKRYEENGCKYSNDIEAYANGIISHNNKIDNGYINQSVQSNYHNNDNKPFTNNTKPMIYENKFPTNFICPAPFYSAAHQPQHQPQHHKHITSSSTSSASSPLYHDNLHYLHQQLYTNDASYRDSWMVRSTDMLQHISEREPEDVDNDPSINAKHPTLFFKRSKEDIEQNILKRRQEHYRRAMHYGQLRAWSSCSTILLDETTISQPGPALALKTLALAIHLHVVSRDKYRSSNEDGDINENENDNYRCAHDDPVYAIFDERLHPVMSSGRQNGNNNNNHNTNSTDDHDYNSRYNSNLPPSHKEIYRYLRHIFNMAQLTPECAIVTLVYLERLITSAEMEILPWSWRRQVLASVLLASKVWDDQAVWNADYCQIMKDLCIEDVNELERSFLELIQFNINVPASVYAHYYFDLLQLGRAHGIYGNHRHPLLWDRALRLEALPCPSGPLYDHNPRWWVRPVPVARFPSWESICAPPRMMRRVILS